MNTETSAHSLDQFDLLPPSFRYQNRVREVCCGWLTINVALLAIMAGVAAATVMRIRGQREMNLQIASTAIPLMDLRRDVVRLQEENSQRNQWCRSIDSSRPDDAALQTLAAITAATQGERQGILVDSIHVRLPIEYPVSAAKRPDWAVAQVVITARVVSDAVQTWLDRLNQFDRIADASLASPSVSEEFRGVDLSNVGSISGDRGSIQVTATPLSTRVLP